MFKKILIANRGEAALRVMRACRELGVATVAVCSTADREALHARLADQRVCVGPERAEDSYLNIPAMLSAALSRGADADPSRLRPPRRERRLRRGLHALRPGVHRSARPPSPPHGRQTRARRIVEKAGVPVLPGSPEPLADVTDARAVADALGYPILVKAAAGGGGRGLGVARDPDGLAAAFAVARTEGERVYGNNLVYVERYLEQARHVEVQLVGDRDRHVVLLGERDCSVQRDRQKLVAEGPAEGLPRGVRAKLAEAATRAATAVGYTNVGSVEFLVEADGTFHFIEMNTRVQVEHAVPEALTGVDLVQAGIRVAAGEPLALRAEDVVVRGHAIECRVHAEWARARRRHAARSGHFTPRRARHPRRVGARGRGRGRDRGRAAPRQGARARRHPRSGSRASQAALAELVIDGVPTGVALPRAHPRTPPSSRAGPCAPTGSRTA